MGGKLTINCLFFCCCCLVVNQGRSEEQEQLCGEEQIKPSPNGANPRTPQLESHRDTLQELPLQEPVPYIPQDISSGRARSTPPGARGAVTDQPDPFGISFPMLQTPGKDEESGKASTFCLSSGPEPGADPASAPGKAAPHRLPVNWGRIRGQEGV